MHWAYLNAKQILSPAKNSPNTIDLWQFTSNFYYYGLWRKQKWGCEPKDVPLLFKIIAFSVSQHIPHEFIYIYMLPNSQLWTVHK